MMLTMSFIREHCPCIVCNEHIGKILVCIFELISPLMMSILKNTGTPLALPIQTIIFFTFTPSIGTIGTLLSGASHKKWSCHEATHFSQHGMKKECVTRWWLFRKLKGNLLPHTAAGCKVSQAILDDCVCMWQHRGWSQNNHSGTSSSDF